MSTEVMIAQCDAYLKARTGRYDWRKVRYHTAIDFMKANGLCDTQTIYDVGAGMTEFDYALRTYGEFRGRYIPIDGAIDGTQLEVWTPSREADWFVCLELLEHLNNPYRLILAMEKMVQPGGGIVISTPNPETTDVLGMDPTHKTPLSKVWLKVGGYKLEEKSFYGKPRDSWFATWRRY